MRTSLRDTYSLRGWLLYLLGEFFVLLSDLVELLHSLFEIGASFQSDEQLGSLAIASVTLHNDCLGLDLLKSGIVVSIDKQRLIQHAWESLIT